MLNSAHRIAEHHLSTVTEALLAPREADFSAYFTLPATFVWSKGLRFFKSKEQLDEAVDCLRTNYRKRQVTDVERKLEYASFVTGDLIVRCHRSEWRGSGGKKERPYSTVSVLRQNSEGWKACVSQFSDAMPISLTETENSLANETDGDNARSVLQTVLDNLSKSFLTRRFETYLDCLCPTLVAQSPSSSEIMTSTEDMNNRFQNVMRFMDIIDARDVVRVAKSAYQLSDDMIVGNFRSYILRGDKQLYPPHQGAIILVRMGEEWKMLSVLNGIDMKP